MDHGTRNDLRTPDDSSGRSPGGTDASSGRRADGGSDRPPTPDVYLLVGQSNMAGRAAIDGDAGAVLERAALFTDEGEWVRASNPLNRYSTIGKAGPPQGLNPGYTFAIEVAEARPDRTVGLVVNARGGTPIEEWSRGERNYDEAVRRAVAAREDGRLRGVLWHQGESNSDDPDYLAKLTELVESFREDLDTPELPFVAGQVAGDSPVNREIADLPGAVPFTGVVESDGLTTFDGVHFDSRSQRELGRRFAAALLQI